MIKRIPTVILLLFLFIFSCKKDNPIGYPSVQIVSPAGLNTFAVFDTITIKANVSDASHLQLITVYITNAQNEPVLPTSVIPITGKSMSFTCRYALNNIHLANGEYTIVVSASNGTNTQLAFQQVYIDAAPTVRLGIYTITRNSSGVHVSKIDTNFMVSTIYTQGGDYSSSDISSYYQQLYISAADSGSATALSMPGALPVWSLPGLISPAPYFTNVYSYGDAVYVSEYYNGYVKYINHSGALMNTITAAAGYYPIKTCVWNNYLFAEEKNIASPLRNLVVYYAPTGANYEQAVIPGPVVAMYGMDANDLFVFGNKTTGGAYMQLYNVPGNIFYSPITLPAANLLSVTQVDTQTYLLGFDNGTIYTYSYSPNGLVPYLTGITASHMQFDAVDNELVVSSGKYVYEYNCNPLTLIYTANLQDSVLNLHLLYNK